MNHESESLGSIARPEAGSPQDQQGEGAPDFRHCGFFAVRALHAIGGMRSVTASGPAKDRFL